MFPEPSPRGRLMRMRRAVRRQRRALRRRRRAFRRWRRGLGLRQRLLLAAALAIPLIGATAAFAYFEWIKAPENVSNPDVEFNTEAPEQKQKQDEKETFRWPFYGYTPARTRYLDSPIDPPFEKLWDYKSGSLIEFQPVLADGVLYVVPNSGTATAIDAKTGKVKWKTKVGSLAASSPAFDKGKLFITTLSGRITCLDAKTGKRHWKRNLPSRSESSPVVIDNKVYFGSENGTVYSLRSKDGSVVWTHHASGAVKAALAYHDGLLYFGDYSGNMTALHARTGSQAWSAATSGRAFQQSGRFYSTPAVAYGRVFAGNTDGFVYSFAAHTGKLAWRYQTGAYVYSAPAVGPGPQGKPTVFIGSYDTNLYAFDARSGNVLWKYPAGGRISGAPSLIGRVLYFSTLDGSNTKGINVENGRRIFRRDTGKFNPMISDGKRMYMTGFSTIYTMVPPRYDRPQDIRREERLRKAREKKEREEKKKSKKK
ncbi:MAG TPA: PQQ-binding-like beta-propeller repeat protein [Thermoleophilaceae bacterium]|nr:PQQ-binding-like beta-propeller repeat protein [Thermoleophilaceae bacterium]